MRSSILLMVIVLAAFGSLGAGSRAHAEVWNLTGAGGIQATGAVITFGTLEAKAYVIDTNNGSADTTTTDLLNGGGTSFSSPLLAAQLGQYATGLGVTTVNQGGDNGTGSPEHTMDNQLGFEFIVFKLPSDFDLSSLSLSSVSGGLGTGTGDADITVWIGGDTFTDFSDFDNNTLGTILGNPDPASLSGSNFQRLNLLTSDPAALIEPTTSACLACTYIDPTTTSGQWLIVGAGLTAAGSQVVDRDDNALITSFTTLAPPTTEQEEVWDLTGLGGIQAPDDIMTFGTLEAKAYVIDTNNGAANTTTTDLLNGGGASSASPLLPAQLGQYSTGLGVTTVNQGADNGTGSPEHTMDNQLGFEFIVFKLPSDSDLLSLSLSSVSGGLGTGTGDADITAWIGGDTFTSFSDFDSKTLGTILGSPDPTSLSGSNFQRLNLLTSDQAALIEPTTSACLACTYFDPATISGEWLIVAAGFTIADGQIRDRDDNVLITSFTTLASPTNVSEPATLALFGLGLLGLCVRRWKRIAN